MRRRLQYFWWVSMKLAAAGLFLGLALGAWGTLLFLQDKDDYDATRQAALRSLQIEQAKVQSALGDVHHRLEKITADIATEQPRIKQRSEVIAQLKELDSTWDKLTGDAQQQANSERRADLEKKQAEATARVAALQTDYTRTGWERDGLEIELAQLDRQLRATEQQSKVSHYLRRAWTYQIGGMKVNGWVGILLSLYLLGLTVRGMAMERPAGAPTRGN